MPHIEDRGPASRRGLRPDLLAGLMAQRGWSAPEVHRSVGSTNELALADPRPGRVLVADHQSGGRGRRGRSWQAPQDASLALSVVLRMPEEAARAGWVPLLVGVAVVDAAEATGVRAGLKWPNDVLAGTTRPDGKLAGILCRALTGNAGPVVVVGVGVNVDLTADERPTSSATSLALAGAGAIDREVLVTNVLDGLREFERAWCDGGAAFTSAQRRYRELCVTLGQQVRVERAGDELTGLATGVDDSGRLVVATAAGEVASSSGDVVHVRAVPA